MDDKVSGADDHLDDGMLMGRRPLATVERYRRLAKVGRRQAGRESDSDERAFWESLALHWDALAEA